MCVIAQVARVQFSIEPQRRFYSFSINKKCLFISHFCKGGGNATLRSKGTSFVERKPTLITVVPLPESLKILLTIKYNDLGLSSSGSQRERQQLCRMIDSLVSPE